jgi:UDP-glucuronate decarboxylase
MSPIFSKPNVLVTGGAGFLGSHLCDELIKKNKIICLDNFISGHEENIDHLMANHDFEFIRHDIVKPIDLEALPALERFKVKFQGVQEVWHLACPTPLKDFKAQSIETLQTNALGTINALEIARRYNAKFLFTSSSVVYGPRKGNNLFYQEEDAGIVEILSERACYDEGKRFAETACFTYQQKYKFPVKIARVFRTYGPRMPLNSGQMVPDFLVNAIDNEDLIIYGDKNLRTSLCYISDIIDGLIKMMSQEQGFLVLNLGSPQDLAEALVAEKAIALAESSSKIVFKDAPVFKTPLGLPNIQKAKEQLGWFPLIPLEQGLKRTYDYTLAQKGIIGI